MRLITLRRSTPNALAIYQQLLPRLMDFAARIEANPYAIVQSVHQGFLQDSPYVGLWVVVDDSGDVVGHAVGQLQEWEGHLWGWINQVEMDLPAERSMKDEFLAGLKQWVYDMNEALSAQKQALSIKGLMFITPRNAEAFARHAGFEPYRSILKLEVL